MFVLQTTWKFALFGAVVGTANPRSSSHGHAVGNIENEPVSPASAVTSPMSPTSLLDSTIEVLETMQDRYFQNWLGTWPSAIDWTAAVMGTHVSGALTTISRSLDLLSTVDRHQENLVTLFFSQVLSYYFGQDSFAIRNEAYDDILWVVLGWLETIQFIDLHTSMTSARIMEVMSEYLDAHGFEKWHGNIWVPAFAHRSRIFWNLARSGWDWDLCGGGMVWNPRLEPYKNAITNQLLISASSAMYLHFPGDWNHSPFFSDADITSPGQFARPSANDVFRPSDPTFRKFALDGYRWLQSSDMTNDRGLYIDGFHISGWNDPRSTNKRCDVRNEQVYTYNQGVILTGQLNLWKITGNYSYVKDGHELIQSVIAATGWDLRKDRPIDRGVPHEHDGFGGKRPWKGRKLPRWHGLGRAGVIEEVCDSTGTCSQDAQTFKGIFFHHLTTFCDPRVSITQFVEVTSNLSEEIGLHLRWCNYYVPWLRHNKHAMMVTRNEEGKVGMWWTAGLLGIWDQEDMPPDEDGADMMVPDAVDYRNDGVPDDPLWRRMPSAVKPPSLPKVPLPGAQRHLMEERPFWEESEQENSDRRAEAYERDLNDRGRGRTVETQGSSLALLRAYWEISDGLGRARGHSRSGEMDEL